jgi:aspartate aminotransferase
VTNGGKQAIFNALLALVNAGDEVLFGAPYWLSYPEMTKITGGKPVVIETTLQDRFKVQPKDLEAQLRNCVHPRVFIINSPSNPTGAMYTRSELIELGRVIDQFPDLCVISDEIYDRVLMGEIPFCSFLDACPGLRDRVITVNGMSKSAAMTGWRIGWSVAEPWITQGMSTIQGQSTSGINSLGQWASVAALKLPESAFAEWTESYQKRWRLALEILRKPGRIEVFPPDGAFYAFLGVGNYLNPGEDSIGLAERILESVKVAVVPATPFGAPKYIRISFATDEKTLKDGCERLVRFFEG